MAASAATILMPLVGSVGAKAATGPLHINPAEETIRLGPLSVRFLVTGRHSTGSLAAFEIMVPGRQRLMAPAHSHDKYEETIYGIDGVLTWTVNGARFEIGPGQALCIAWRRSSVRQSRRHGREDALRDQPSRHRSSVLPRIGGGHQCSNLPVRRTKSRWLRSCGATA
jgi:hypothetical protein